MSEISFAQPQLWPWLLLSPLLWWGLYRVLRGRRAAREDYGAQLRDLPAGPGARAARLSLAMLLLFVCIMEPRFGAETVQVERRGLDVVLALDVSRSMLARDMEPSRLEAARRDIFAVLGDLRGGDRAALLAFAGKARVVVPLTHDMDSLRQLLQGVDELAVPEGGSDLAAALRRGLRLLGEEQYNSSAIVLLTDGEDLAGEGQKAAAEAARRGVVVHAIGYGSDQGSKILIEAGRRQYFLRDGQGREVVSTMDARSLRAVAAAAGGEFLRAARMVLPLRELKRKRLDVMDRRGFDPGEETVFKTRFQWVLLPAMLLLLAELYYCRGVRRC